MSARAINADRDPTAAAAAWLRDNLPEPVRRPLRPLAAGYRTATASMRELPGFLIIGAQKAGTSSLYRYLTANPALEPARTKEVHYFDAGYSRGERWYRSHFPTARRMRHLRRVYGRALTGEATPYYLMHPLAPERAAALVPEAEIVVLLRDPVERAISHQNHFLAAGYDTLPLAEAIDAEPARLQGEVERMLAEPGYESGPLQSYSYLARGQYAEQLERWFTHFDRERFLILPSSLLFEQPEEALRRGCEFFGVEPNRLPAYAAYNARDYPPPDPELVERLRAHFEPHNRRLYELLGEDFGW